MATGFGLYASSQKKLTISEKSSVDKDPDIHPSDMKVLLHNYSAIEKALGMPEVQELQKIINKSKSRHEP